MDRKALKKNGRSCVRRHWLLFSALCLAIALLGSGFQGTLQAISLRRTDLRSDLQEVRSSGVSVRRVRDRILSTVPLYETLERLVTWDDDALAQRTQEKREEALAREDQMLGRTRGVLAAVVNSLSSGSVWVTVLATLTNLVHSRDLGLAIMIVFSGLGLLCFWFFIQNVAQSAMRRMFLEGRVYQRVPLNHLFFFARVRRWLRAALTLALMALRLFCWWLTLAGGFVKACAYAMVPFLVAENPDIPPREAIALSRRMMEGHKWEYFKLELSFVGWWALSALTLGISGLLWSNPFEMATLGEYYVRRREAHMADHPEDAPFFNDPWLFARCPEEALEGAYAVELEESRFVEGLPLPEGPKGFLARNFGLLLTEGSAERTYEAKREEEVRLRQMVSEGTGRCYPTRLCPLEARRGKGRLMVLRPSRCYSLWSIIAIFFIFSVIGWLWEVAIALVQSGHWINRGVLHGPWLPIYGAGGGLVLLLLYRFRSKPVLEFLLSVALCGTVEYLTSYFMEVMHGEKWWDYSGYFLNLNGRVCAEGLLVFGAGGCLGVYLLAPLLDRKLKQVPRRALIPVCLVLCLLFAADTVYSNRHPNVGEGITDVSAAVEEICPPPAAEGIPIEGRGRL